MQTGEEGKERGKRPCKQEEEESKRKNFSVETAQNPLFFFVSNLTQSQSVERKHLLLLLWLLPGCAAAQRYFKASADDQDLTSLTVAPTLRGKQQLQFPPPSLFLAMSAEAGKSRPETGTCVLLKAL